MAKFQLERLAPESLSQDLVAEANPENRDIRLHQLGDGFYRIIQGRRVSRSVGKKNPRWFMFEHLFGRRGGRNHPNPESLLPQPAQDIVFHAEVVSHDRNVGGRERLANLPWIGWSWPAHQSEIRALRIFFIPQERFLVSHFLHVIDSDQSLPFSGSVDSGLSGDFFGRDEPFKRSAYPQSFRQRPRVNPLDPGNAILFEIISQRIIRAPVADHRR